MNPRPLKVYYCNDCGTRMPLYYKEGNPFRNPTWRKCHNCGGSNIQDQVEVWDWIREQRAKSAVTKKQLDNVRRNAILWKDFEKQEANNKNTQLLSTKDGQPF